MLEHEYLVAKIVFDTVERRPSRVRVINRSPTYPGSCPPPRGQINSYVNYEPGDGRELLRARFDDHGRRLGRWSVSGVRKLIQDTLRTEAACQERCADIIISATFCFVQNRFIGLSGARARKHYRRRLCFF